MSSKARIKLVYNNGRYESDCHVYSDGTPMSVRDAMTYVVSWLSGDEGMNYAQLDRPVKNTKPVEWRRYY